MYLRIFSVVAIALELVRKRHHHDHELLQKPVIVCAEPLFSTESKMGEYKTSLAQAHGLGPSKSIWTVSMDPIYLLPLKIL